jgi:hypothetical protein
MDREQLAARRDYIYHRRQDRRVRREADALGFINEVGVCFLFSAEGSEMPTLYEAIVGDQSAWTTAHDYETGLAWRWKDSLPIDRKCFYGKLLRGKPVLVSLAMFPYFYAVSGNYGDLDQYLEDYSDGKISLAAKQIYEALLFHGALPTSVLRRQANLPGKQNARDFERGLAELQMGMKITKTGISDANRWRYCYIYDLLPRWLPDLVEMAVAMKSRDAYPVILRQHLRNVIVATPADIARLFGWTQDVVDRAVSALVAAGEVRQGVRIEGLPGEWLGWAAEVG